MKRGRKPKNAVSDLSEGLDDDLEEAAPVRGQLREPRVGIRGGAVARGRDGKILTRTRKTSGDKFYFDAAIIPHGWAYQWNTVSVLGSTAEARSTSLQMQANGWTPVPAERHDGLFTPVGYKGEIVVDGNRLEERPKILSEEAHYEDIQAARQLISDRNEALKLSGVNKDLPSGFNNLQGAQRRVLNTGGNNVRMSMDASLDAEIPRPSYQPPEPGE